MQKYFENKNNSEKNLDQTKSFSRYKNIFKKLKPILFDLIKNRFNNCFEDCYKEKITCVGYKNFDPIFKIEIDYDKENYKFIKDYFEENFVCYFKTNRRLKKTKQIEFKKSIELNGLKIKTNNIRGSITINSFDNIIRIEFYSIYYLKILDRIERFKQENGVCFCKNKLNRIYI